MKLQLILTLIVLLNGVCGQQIAWQLGRFGYWAKACDFTGNDMKGVVMTSDGCAQKCSTTFGCTHFAWSTWNTGTCWLKKATTKVSQTDAKYTNDFTMICGILTGEFFWSFFFLKIQQQKRSSRFRLGNRLDFAFGPK